MKRCEDCGERAKYETADGVWLCRGDFELLCERYESLGPDDGKVLTARIMRAPTRTGDEHDAP